MLKMAKAILSGHFVGIFFEEVIWMPRWVIKGLFNDFAVNEITGDQNKK